MKRNLLERVKEWIIKKLGGYTASEYAERPVRYEYIPRPSGGGFTTLRAEATLDTFKTIPHEWVEGNMLDDLAKQMKPFVYWEFNDDYMNFKKKVRATLRVVKWDG